jgi:hypothetical protein
MYEKREQILPVLAAAVFMRSSPVLLSSTEIRCDFRWENRYPKWKSGVTNEKRPEKQPERVTREDQGWTVGNRGVLCEGLGSQGQDGQQQRTTPRQFPLFLAKSDSCLKVLHNTRRFCVESRLRRLGRE